MEQQSIVDSFTKVKRTEKASLSGRMVLTMKETSLMDSFKDSESITSLILIRFTKESLE